MREPSGELENQDLSEREHLQKERLEAYQDWLTTLDKEAEEGRLTADRKHLMIARALLARDRKAERFQGRAFTDQLTTLPNHRAYTTRFREAVTEAEREGGKRFGLLILDLDHFKEINDSHGHLTGDKILVQTGLTLLSNLRAQREERENDFVARYGGEEFAVILPGVQNELDLERIAEKLRTTFEQNPLSVTVEGERKNISITVSIGGGVFRKGQDPEEFFNKVDIGGLYEAKQTGRNKTIIVKGNHG